MNLSPEIKRLDEPVPPRTWRASFAYLGLWLLSSEFRMWVVALFLVGFGLYELAKQELGILSWEQTQGTVVESRIVGLELRNGRLGPALKVRVQYRYKVDGKEFESTRLTTGEPPKFYEVEDAVAFRDQYPPGTPVTVLYLPDNPADATLSVERGSGPWILLGFGVPCLVLVIYVRRRRRRRKEELHPEVEVPVHAFLH
jgi:hypothetical protein